MAAIITEPFRRKNVNNFKEDLLAGGFYIGIGMSNPWEIGIPETDGAFSAPEPTGSINERNEVLDNLIGMKSVDTTNFSTVIPKNTWYTNRRFKPFDPADNTCFDKSGLYYPCYVYNQSNRSVYLCLSVPTSNTISTQRPNVADIGVPFEVSDGYVWVKLYEVQINDPFSNSRGFIPVKDDSVGSPETLSPAVSVGQIFGFSIENGGESYIAGSFDITCEVEYEDGTGATLTVPSIIEVSLGSISYVTVDFSDFTDEAQSIVRASVKEIVGAAGTGAYLVPKLMPVDGFADSPEEVLPSYYLGFAADFDNDEGGDISNRISYRQISLIKDPVTVDDNDSPFTPLSISTLSFIECGDADVSQYYYADHGGKIITFSNGAKAWLDYVEPAGYGSNLARVYFHQNSSESINRLAAGGVTFSIDQGGPVDVSITNIVNEHNPDSNTPPSTPEYTAKTGEVIFLDNRKPITRTDDQIDNIHLVIQF